MVSLPRLVVAAPASGHGKTTVATGLMAALARAGHCVSGHKVGPDFIDPGYHALATGRPGRNLDPHLVGEQLLVPLLLHGATTGGRLADIAVIEGVMGLYDGRLGSDGYASTAHVASVTRSPVVLVVDISHASRSIAALVHGMTSFDPGVHVVGVVLNKAGSARHADEVVRALEPLGVPVLGVLHRDDGVVAPARHLGLVPAAERADAAAALDTLAHRTAEALDLPRLVALAQAAPDLEATPWDPVAALGADARPRDGARPVVAVAGGRAFTFRYTETTELLAAAGCDVAVFDPLTDSALPPGTSGIYLGGGFPEVHAAGLSANQQLRAALHAAVSAGVPTVAECAGLLYLCRSLDAAPMVGLLEAEARMTPRLTLAYRTATAPRDHLLASAGTEVTGHEFHRTTVDPAAPAGPAQGGTVGPAWATDAGPAGFATGTVHASYLHTHWAGHPHLATRFAAAVRRFDASMPGPRWETTAPLTGSSPGDLRAGPAPADWARHHGDAELGAGLVDFAVNVYDGPRPGWLDDALRDSLAEIGRYPDPAEAQAALAARHGREPGEVLATAGAAEAFGLLARLRAWRRPVVVHPQFTEPDAALVAAGHAPTHVRCDPGAGFRLDPSLVPDDADLVVVGNPTNPTGVLHPEATLRSLLRPGRVLVVDEAFMDGVPGERHSLAASRVPGLVVVRSLTKLWSVPGVRAGYLLAEDTLVDQLRTLQPPWSVSTTAAAAMWACAGEVAAAEATARAATIARRRAVLVDGLAELGVPVGARSEAPFVLARPGAGVRARLRAAGYAVRRADTFPGLDDTWVRIAVRRPEVTRKLLATLRAEGNVTPD